MPVIILIITLVVISIITVFVLDVRSTKKDKEWVKKEMERRQKASDLSAAAREKRFKESLIIANREKHNNSVE